jgi:hypothetical protein
MAAIVSTIARYLGGDLSCFRPERLSELHSAASSGRHRGTVYGRPVRLALPVGDLRVSGRRSGASAGQSLRPVGGGRAGPGDRQHSCLPRFDGPERASAGPLRGCTVGGDSRRCATGLYQVVPAALAVTGVISEIDKGRRPPLRSCVLDHP